MMRWVVEADFSTMQVLTAVAKSQERAPDERSADQSPGTSIEHTVHKRSANNHMHDLAIAFNQHLMLEIIRD